MELSQKEQLTLFQALAKSDGQNDPELWEKGATFCLQYDKKNPNTKGVSQLKRYLNNGIKSDNSRCFSGLDVQSVDKWLNQGIREGILTYNDRYILHAQIILSQALISKKDRDKILSEPDTREEILKQLPQKNDNPDLKKIAEEIETIEQKIAKARARLETRNKLRKGAKEDGVAPSQKTKELFKDPEELRNIRARAKKEGDPAKNLAPRTTSHKEFQKFMDDIRLEDLFSSGFEK